MRLRPKKIVFPENMAKKIEKNRVGTVGQIFFCFWSDNGAKLR